jgi:hypothetical protein
MQNELCAGVEYLKFDGARVTDIKSEPGELKNSFRSRCFNHVRSFAILPALRKRLTRARITSGS